MKDKNIIRISLLTSILGILLLFFIVNVQDKYENDDYLTYMELENNDDVRLNGYVKNIRIFEDVTFIEINIVESVRIVLFEKIELNQTNQELLIGKKIDVVGRISLNDEHGRSIIGEKIIIDN